MWKCVIPRKWAWCYVDKQTYTTCTCTFHWLLAKIITLLYECILQHVNTIIIDSNKYIMYSLYIIYIYLAYQ